MMTMRVLVAAGLALWAMPAKAQDDGQAWTQVLVLGSIKDDLIFWAEGQARITDAAHASQFIVRPAIGLRLSATTAAHLGYAYVRTDPVNGTTTNEHRVWEQLTFPIVRNRRGLVITGRSRVEQRLVEGRRDTGWRLRQFVRAQMPVRPGSTVAGVVIVEGFYAANSTDWGARAGFDQVRTFLGVSVPISKQFVIEPGYLNQTIFRRGPDRINHVASLSLIARL